MLPNNLPGDGTCAADFVCGGAGPEEVLLEPGGVAPVGDFVGRAWCPTPSALRR